MSLTADDLFKIKEVFKAALKEVIEERREPLPATSIDFIELQAVSRAAHAAGDPKRIQEYLNKGRKAGNHA